MLSLFAATDPGTGVTAYLFTQGVLGIACIVLGAVIYYQNKKLDKQQTRIEQLQDLRLEDSKEVTRDVTGVLQQNSQSNLVLAEKINTAKRNGSKQ